MNKKTMIYALFLIDAVIILSGILFSVYSIRMNVEFPALNSHIPGYIFGLVAVFLGVRYFKATLKLKRSISDPSIRFSWSNFRGMFKKNKKLKAVRNKI